VKLVGGEGTAGFVGSLVLTHHDLYFTEGFSAVRDLKTPGADTFFVNRLRLAQVAGGCGQSEGALVNEAEVEVAVANGRMRGAKEVLVNFDCLLHAQL